MIFNYIDTCIYIVSTFILADITVRCFKVMREYKRYEKHYLPQQRLLNIVRRAFYYNIATIILFVGLISVSAIRLRFGPTVTHFLFPPATYLKTGIPLYWLFSVVRPDHSSLDYANFIREHHGLDYASGMASNYFHGYLKLTLPSYTGHPGIRERIKLYEAQHNIQFAINRLVILVPSTMFINSMIESQILEKAAPLELVMLNRAGVHRPFKNDVYRIKRPIDGKFCYIALEGATPMLSFFEAMNFQLSTTWQMKEMQREILFKFYKHLRKLLSEWPETQQEAELVLYNDYRENGSLQDVGEVIYAHLENLRNESRMC